MTATSPDVRNADSRLRKSTDFGDIGHSCQEALWRIVLHMPCVPLVVQSYRDLIVWQRSVDLVTEIYQCTQAFPKTETYGLVSQLRRAAVSVASNIAEGHARLTTGEFRQFLGHALGSLMEIETQILIADRLGYIDSRSAAELIRRTAEVGKLLNGLLRSLTKA